MKNIADTMNGLSITCPNLNFFDPNKVNQEVFSKYEKSGIKNVS